MRLRKTLFVLGMSFLVGIFSLTQISYANFSSDDLRPKRASESDAKMWAEGFLSPVGVKFAHDKILKEKMQMAFNTGLGINIFGHSQISGKDFTKAITKAAKEVGVVEENLNVRVLEAMKFLYNVFADDDFINSIVIQIKRIDEKKVEAAVKKGSVKQEALDFLRLVKSAKDIVEARKILVDETRFVLFIFGEKGLDPYLYSIGDIASDEHRTLIAHAGRFKYDGSDKIAGGPRSIYLTLARIEGFAKRGMDGLEAFRGKMIHEFEDLARGRHSSINDFESDRSIPDQVTPLVSKISRINKRIDEEYRVNILKVVKGVVEVGDYKGAPTVDTDKVHIEKYQVLTDLGTQAVFAIKGSSRVHPDVPKGSRKINLMFVKADVGSIGGHGTVSGAMLEAVVDVWAKAAEEGKIMDFFITRCGDDISITVTHINGKDNPMMHKLAWDGFINATVVAKDMGWYGAGQDLLADAFSGNVKGAGPGVSELEFVERPSEPIIVLQADKCGPGVFNEAIRWTYADPNSAYVSLKPDKAGKVQFGVIDFEHNNKVGRTAIIDPQKMKGMEFAQAISYIAGEQTRYSFTNLTLDGEDIAGVTATRLHNIAGEYTGKDDPGMVVRTQKDLPAEGIFTAPFFKLYVAIGWMMGSKKGYLLPCALKDARIGVYDGPPLLVAFGFNINNGRLEGFYDIFAANPAVRAVQDMVAAKTSELLSSADFWTQGKGRAPSVELAYQRGLTVTDKVIPWVELEPPKEEAAHLEPLAKFQDVARAFSHASPRQTEITKALALVGPRAKVVVSDGKPVAVINPLVQEYHRALGIDFSDNEDLTHEQAEAVLSRADEDRILTADMLLQRLDTAETELLKKVYNETYGYMGKFDDDPGFAIRHLLAERHDGGNLHFPVRQAVAAENLLNGLYEFAKNLLEENGLSLNTTLDVVMLPPDGVEAIATRQRIAQAEKTIGLAREEVAKAAARRRDLVALKGTDIEQYLRLEVLEDVREQIDNLGTMIARSDLFYSDITYEDISFQELTGITILITAADVINNLAGFREQYIKLGSLPIQIVARDAVEEMQVKRLIETGFLPKNIEVIQSKDINIRKLGEQNVIVMGFEENLKASEIREYDLNKRDREKGRGLGALLMQQIIFAKVREEEILNWERPFAALAISIMGRDPGIVKTNLESGLMAAIVRGDDITNLKVGISVTKELLEDAKRAYDALRIGI